MTVSVDSLPATSSLDGTEVMLVLQGGTTKNVTVAIVQTYLEGELGALESASGVLDTTDGTDLGFFGETPVSQPSLISNASEAHSLVPVPDAGDTTQAALFAKTNGAKGCIQDMEDSINALVSKVNEIKSALEDLGILGT